ncbi:MAG: peptidase [Cyclobacteriaceae bacterium]|nr:MAG: peptidase [Cyclobacteriaceae bacterium]
MKSKHTLIVDAHLDLATNAMTLNRDLTLPVQAIREKEIELGWDDYQDRGKGTVALPELRDGNVALVFTTIISRVDQIGKPLKTMSLPGWHSPAQAYANGQAQLAWYRAVEELGEMVQIYDLGSLDRHLDHWQQYEDQKVPVGYILALEGADSIVDLDYLHRYYEQGLRSIGLSHYGPGRYAAGTHSDGSGLTQLGRELLREMNQLDILLDLTHLTDKGFYEALEIFEGLVLASHQNCRTLVPGERQFTDDQIRLVIERGGVLGGALDTWMLHPGFHMNKDHPKDLGINLEKLVDHFDHICQIAGNSLHIGFGSDLDGLFGLEQTPYDMDTIADIQKFSTILESRGYSESDIENIFHKNWIRLVTRAWS